MTGTRILILARDAQLRATLARWLTSAGYAVELAESVRRAREVLGNGDIVLAVVAPAGLGTGSEADQMPELRGIVRHLITIGLPGATADDSPEHDIYMSAPSAQQDLLRRVKATLEARIAAAEPGEASLFRFEAFTLDAGGRKLQNAGGEEIALTRAEFAILLALLRQAGRVLSRDELSHAALGRGAEPEDRSVDVLVSRLRRKVEPAPKTPRIILTVPGGGYKVDVPVQKLTTSPPLGLSLLRAVPSSAAAEPQPKPGEEANPTLATPAVQPLRLRRSSSMAWMLAAATVLAVLAGIAGIVAFRSRSPATREPTLSSIPAQKFDAAAVPLVLDVVRTRLASYERERPAKAIAISREGWGVSFAAADEPAARTEALERCRERDKGGFCRLYAVGDNVVWPKSSPLLPLAADVRADRPASSQVTLESLGRLWQSLRRTTPPPNVTEYVRGANHRALAVGLTDWYAAKGHVSRDEALRIAVERCSDMARTPCLLISVDGVWMVEIPRSYAVSAPFTLAGESQMSEAERQRVAKVYAGGDSRALVRGGSGNWYAVNGREDEAAAVDAALKECGAAEGDCRLHAIGNWRVGERLESAPDSGSRR